MKIDLLDRPRLELLNKRGLRYHLQDAEKDYFLAILINIICNSELKDILIFKGGTAIYHCYLNQLRFSKDLDFTSLNVLKAGDIEKLFADYEILKVKDMGEKKYGLDISVQYRGPLGQPDTISIDINYNQKVLLEPKMMEYKNYYGVNAFCLVMDIKEIFAEKIRTLNDRARPRDLYDLVVLMKRFNIAVKEALLLLKQKDSPKVLNTNNIQENINISLSRWEEDFKELYYKEQVKTEEVKDLTGQILEGINS